MTFSDLGLIEPILRAIGAEGYSVPTAIQTQAIPHVLAGKDVLGCAQTGTGKTAAFSLPILQRLHAATPHGRPRIRALVLCPTRELAAQISESVSTYGRNLGARHTVIFGGVNQFHQVRSLRRGVDLLIATPGRLLDLVNQGHVDLGGVEILVLDEADRMLDMGFIVDIRRVVKLLPTKRQTLLFSATMPKEIRHLADSILNQPVCVQATPESAAAPAINQSVYFVGRKDKQAMLRHVLDNDEVRRALVFTRTKHGADRVVKDLERSGIRAAAIHGNKSQAARTKALASFRSPEPPVLVATDIASRGIDVDGVTHVINFDVPDAPETYVHRIGRTARAGATGFAVSFCDKKDERGEWRAIEKLVGDVIKVEDDRPEGLQLEPARGPAHENKQSQSANRDAPAGWSNGEHRDRRDRNSRPHAQGHGAGNGPRHHDGGPRSGGKRFGKKKQHHPIRSAETNAPAAVGSAHEQPRTRKHRGKSVGRAGGHGGAHHQARAPRPPSR